MSALEQESGLEFEINFNFKTVFIYKYPKYNTDGVGFIASKQLAAFVIVAK
jgi:hypothetical protein